MTTQTQKQLVSDERRLDMLTGALEGGSNYWYEIKEDACKIIEEATTHIQERIPFAERMFAAILKGCAIAIHDLEGDEDDEPIGEISLATMIEREYIMLDQQPEHFADILSENDDATTADVWFQFVTMNEIVYG